MVAILLFLFLMSLSRPAYAYLDLGSGSYIFQVVLATLLAGIYFLKSWWQKPAALIRRLFSKPKDDARQKS